MSVPAHAIVEAPLALEPLVADVEALARGRGEGCGAVCTFVGVVRATHQGRRVDHLEYEAHVALGVKMFERISAEIADRWPAAVVAIHHRIGRLGVGEASVANAAAPAHPAARIPGWRHCNERRKPNAPRG
jgi:molybdopterin synthase catalytic subunit